MPAVSPIPTLPSILIFFSNDTSTTEIYTLSLHDALPIYPRAPAARRPSSAANQSRSPMAEPAPLLAGAVSSRRYFHRPRSEEHTSELQSRFDLVCRLLLEKKKKYHDPHIQVRDFVW